MHFHFNRCIYHQWFWDTSYVLTLTNQFFAFCAFSGFLYKLATKCDLIGNILDYECMNYHEFVHDFMDEKSQIRAYNTTWTIRTLQELSISHACVNATTIHELMLQIRYLNLCDFWVINVYVFFIVIAVHKYSVVFQQLKSPLPKHYFIMTSSWLWSSLWSGDILSHFQVCHAIINHVMYLSVLENRKC